MRSTLYIILVTGTLVMLTCIFLFSKAPSKAPALKERTGDIALSGEWLNSKKAMEGLIAAIEQDPEDYKAMLALSQAYIQEGRVTGNHNYYDKAALELLENILENDEKNFDALCCKATVLLSQHHFREGLDVANKALPLNPYSAFVYGLLCDANLELGNYDEAVKMADKMISVRPDIRSYARVSYLREIFGDVEGSISAMRLATDAGYPGLEQTEWTRCMLAQLYENCGKLDSAELFYQQALIHRPGYAFATAGLGRLAKARGNYKVAIVQMERANKMINEYSFADELTDLYYLNSESKKAEQNAEDVIEMLGPGSGDEGDEGHGHYADKELAYAYLKINDSEKALEHALVEYERRPENIEACETLAWVKYNQGHLEEANNIINKALRTNSKDPVLLARAGLIKIKAGEKQAGKQLVQTALKQNPYLDPALRKQLKQHNS